MIRIKGNPKLNSIALTTAGVTGALTGAALEHLPAPQALAAAVVVGLAVGLVLLAVFKLIARNRSD